MLTETPLRQIVVGTKKVDCPSALQINSDHVLANIGDISNQYQTRWILTLYRRTNSILQSTYGLGNLEGWTDNEADHLDQEIKRRDEVDLQAQVEQQLQEDGLRILKLAALRVTGVERASCLLSERSYEAY